MSTVCESCDSCLSPLCEYSTGTYDSLCDPLLCVIIYTVCNSGDHNDIFKTYMIYFYVYVYCLTCYVKWQGCILIHAPQVCDGGHCTGAYGHFRASAVACMSWECVPKAGGD